MTRGASDVRWSHFKEELQMNRYPGWRYHATKPALIVHDPVQEEALGEGWAESPADVIAVDPDELKLEPEEPKKRPRK